MNMRMAFPRWWERWRSPRWWCFYGRWMMMMMMMMMMMIMMIRTLTFSSSSGSPSSAASLLASLAWVVGNYLPVFNSRCWDIYQSKNNNICLSNKHYFHLIVCHGQTNGVFFLNQILVLPPSVMVLLESKQPECLFGWCLIQLKDFFSWSPRRSVPLLVLLPFA